MAQAQSQIVGGSGRNTPPFTFRQQTRRNEVKAGTITYAAGGQGQLKLNSVGLLSYLIVQFRGVVTLSGAGALADLGPWNLISRMSVDMNIGATSIYNLSGFQAFLASCKVARGWRPDLAGSGQSTPNADVYAAPVASGANTWVLTWYIPISANVGRNFEAGLINLQAPEVSVNLNVAFGALTDPAALATATTGTLHVYQGYFEIPDPRLASIPSQLVVKTMADEIQIVSTGAGSPNTYLIPPQGTLMQLIHYMIANGSRSNAFDGYAVRLNENTTIYNKERQFIRASNRIVNGFDWLTGVFDLDLWNSDSLFSAGDGRDYINSEKLASTKFDLFVTAGTTLGGGALDKFGTVRRFWQDLVV